MMIILICNKLGLLIIKIKMLPSLKDLEINSITLLIKILVLIILIIKILVKIVKIIILYVQLPNNNHNLKKLDLHHLKNQLMEHIIMPIILKIIPVVMETIQQKTLNKILE